MCGCACATWLVIGTLLTVGQYETVLKKPLLCLLTALKRSKRWWEARVAKGNIRQEGFTRQDVKDVHGNDKIMDHCHGDDYGSGL